MDLSSLEKALSSLDDAIAVFKATDSNQKALYNTLRAGLIQNFEFTFEVCWKLVKRWIAQNRTLPDDAIISKREIFRTAAEANLIADPALWFDFLEARNRTSHTYQETNAAATAQIVIEFRNEAKALVENLAKST